MFRIKAAFGCMAGLLAIVSGNLLAQAPQFDPVTFSVDGGGAHQSKADLKDGGGAFDVDRWFVSAGVNYSWNFRNSIGLSIGGGRSNYSFYDGTGFGGGKAWTTAEDFRISAPARFKVSERATAIIVPSVRFNKEKGADSGDSTTYGLFAAVAWRLSEDLTIGPGIGIFSRLEDGANVFPILAIDWNITDRWNLSTGRGLGASQGPGLNLSYKINQYWSLGLAGRYEDAEFRLNEDGPSPGGIGRDQAFPLVFSGIIEPNEDLRFSLFAGLELGGKLKLQDTFGKTIEETKYDPALLIGATFDIRF